MNRNRATESGLMTGTSAETNVSSLQSLVKIINPNRTGKNTNVKGTHYQRQQWNTDISADPKEIKEKIKGNHASQFDNLYEWTKKAQLTKADMRKKSRSDSFPIQQINLICNEKTPLRKTLQAQTALLANSSNHLNGMITILHDPFQK